MNKNSFLSKLLNIDKVYLEWISFILLSAFLYGIYSFLSFTVLNTKFSSPLTLTFILALGQTLLGFILYGSVLLLDKKYSKKIQKKGILKNYTSDFKKIILNKEDLTISTGAGIFNIFGVLTLYQGYPIAPNPGLVDAISDLYNIPQSILTRIFFNKKLNYSQIFGIFLGSIGIFYMIK